MKTSTLSPFEEFAALFIRAYWQTVKDRRFPMPPAEPIEETLEQLLSAVSVDITDENFGKTIMMKSKYGDWWRFTFRAGTHEWIVGSCHAKSLDPQSPHDLLAPPYEGHFRPFLDHVSKIANKSEK